jgi:hypothetical protein
MMRKDRKTVGCVCVCVVTLRGAFAGVFFQVLCLFLRCFLLATSNCCNEYARSVPPAV